MTDNHLMQIKSIAKWGAFFNTLDLQQEIGCKQGLQYTPRNVQLFTVYPPQCAAV